MDLSRQLQSISESMPLHATGGRGIQSGTWLRLIPLVSYQIDSWDPNYTGSLQADLMNHSAVTTKFVPYKANIDYLKSKYANVSYVLSETGTALKGKVEYSNAFGACLSNVDFQLWAMSSGVTRVTGTQRPAAQHALWVPVNVQTNPGPQVRAPFYAQPFVADFIGNSTRPVAAINLDLKSDFLTAYALYEGEALARVALVNLREWNNTMDTPRGNKTFAINVPTGNNKVSVSRLRARAGAAARGFDANGQNITWAGTQWSYKADEGKGQLIAPKSEPITVQDGIATVEIADSEAVMVFFGAYICLAALRRLIVTDPV